jgi:hypothetical protein
MVVWDKAKDTIIFDQKISRPMKLLGPLLKGRNYYNTLQSQWIQQQIYTLRVQILLLY